MPIPFGRYQLVRKLASGGMGQVLLAQKGEADFSKLVVLKRILPHLVEDEEFFTMFRDEAKITMRLDHPNIARINEFGVENGVHFIEMEYVAGEDLRRVEKRAAQVGKGIPVGAILRVIADAAAGLDFAHKARDAKGTPLGLVHRDVSPQNVLIGFDGSVKLIDFGVAKAAGRAQHTATGILKGKFPYMSPEQAQGLDLDPRSDIFSLGIILWEQLTARRLFKAEGDLATQRLVIACQVPPPSTVEPSSPKALDAIVMKALAKSPEDRFEDAAALRMALEEFALANSIPASSGHLAGFMKELYAERIAREADPKFLEEDSGLTDIDAGGAPRNAQGNTVVDRKGNTNTQSVGVGTQAVAPPGASGSKAVLVGVGALVLVGVVGLGLWLKPAPVVTPPVTPVVVVPRVDPVPELKPPPPLEVLLESEPSGATLEIAGRKEGATPYTAKLDRARLPVPVKVTLEGYEPQDFELTTETGPSRKVTLKKVAVRPTTPRPDNTIKTTR